MSQMEPPLLLKFHNILFEQTASSILKIRIKKIITQFKFNTDEEITSPAVCLQLSPTKEYQIDVKLNACKDELTSLGKAVSVISFSILNRINRSQAENYLLSKALGRIADPEMFEPY